MAMGAQCQGSLGISVMHVAFCCCPNQKKLSRAQKEASKIDAVDVALSSGLCLLRCRQGLLPTEKMKRNRAGRWEGGKEDITESHDEGWLNNEGSIC